MSDIAALLSETVTRLFAASVTPETLAEAERGSWLGDLWERVEEHGLTAPHLAGAPSDPGDTWRAAGVIAAATGRHAVPLPVVETMLGAWLLSTAGLEVPPGPIAVAPEPAPGAALARGRLRWRAPRVAWGRRAATLVVVVGETAPVVTAARAFAVASEGTNLAREPRDDLAVDGPVAIGPTPLAPGALRAAGALLRNAQMAGALEAILDLSVRYANDRVQFGRPIGRQQAIQQELARLAGMCAAAAMASEVAAAAAAERGLPDATFEIAVAKVVAGDAAGDGPRIAHQVHGAIGFTYEHALHFFTRRLWAWRGEFGSAEEWARVLGREAVAAGPDGLWPLVTSR